MALESVTLTTGATLDGRVIAVNGAVTLDANHITQMVPEPSTLGFLTAGLLATLVRRRRRVRS